MRTDERLSKYTHNGYIPLSLCAGICTELAVLVPLLWPLAFVGVVFQILLSLSLRDSWRKAATAGYVFGIGIAGTSLLWVWAVDPANWLLGIGITKGITITSSIWLMYTLCLAAPYALWFLCVVAISIHRPALFVVAGTVAWVACEWLHAYLATLLSWAPDSLIGAHYALGIPATALAWHDGLLWLAKAGGVWGLSTALYAVSACIALAIVAYGQRNMITYAITGTLFATFVASFVVTPASVTTLGAARVQVFGTEIVLIKTDFVSVGMFTQTEHASRIQTLAEQVLRALDNANEAPIILLPEDSRFAARFWLLESPIAAEMSERLVEQDAIVVDSGRIEEDGETFNTIRAFDFGSSGGELLHAQKTLLSPFGEYLPAAFRFAWNTLGFDEHIDRFDRSRSYAANTSDFDPQRHIFTAGGVRFGILSCSEAASSTLYPRVAATSDVLLNVSSLAASDGSPMLFNQMLALEKIHAVHTSKPYLKAANKAVSVVVVPHQHTKDVYIVE